MLPEPEKNDRQLTLALALRLTYLQIPNTKKYERKRRSKF